MTDEIKVGAVSVFVGVLIVGVILSAVLFLYQTFAPAYEEARHDTYQRSTAFVEGKVQALYRYQLDYERHVGEIRQQQAMRRMILHEASTLHPDDMPHDLAVFIKELKETVPHSNAPPLLRNPNK